MKLNLHTHTTRCGHASGSEREYIERAIAAGITTLGFSDHAPMPFKGDYYSGFRVKREELPEYIETLSALREEYKRDIHLLIGFEVEYYPALFRDFLEFIAPYPVDYLIMGQHFLDNEQNAHYTGSGTADEALLAKYVDQVSEGLATGLFTFLAHPDVMRFTGDESVYEKHMRRLCENARSLDVPLEINGLGLWNNRHYPSDRFFRIAGEVGNQIIYSLDAHQPERILEADVLSAAHAMAARCGLTITEDITIRKVHTL